MDFTFDLFLRSIRGALSSIGTTAGQLMFSFAVTILLLLYLAMKRGVSNMKQHWKENILDGVIVAAIVWGLMVLYQFTYGVPSKITRVAAEAEPPRFTMSRSPPTFWDQWHIDPATKEQLDAINQRLSSLHDSNPEGTLPLSATMGTEFAATITPGPEARRRIAIIEALRDKYDLLLPTDLLLPRQMFPPIEWINRELVKLDEKWILSSESTEVNFLYIER